MWRKSVIYRFSASLKREAAILSDTLKDCKKMKKQFGVIFTFLKNPGSLLLPACFQVELGKHVERDRVSSARQSVLKMLLCLHKITYQKIKRKNRRNMHGKTAADLRVLFWENKPLLPYFDLQRPNQCIYTKLCIELVFQLICRISDALGVRRCALYCIVFSFRR